MSTEEPQAQEGIDSEDETTDTTEDETELHDTVSPGEPELDEFFWRLRAYVGMVTSKRINSLSIVAKPGIGKSHTITDQLKQDVGKSGYVKISGYCSPLSLYHKLYEVHDGGVLVLDDVAGIPKDERSMELLKAATWTEDEEDGRVVSWETTSGKLEAPPSFKFEGTVISVFNDLPDNEMSRAFIDRSLTYNMAFTYHERLHIMREVAKKPYENLSYEERIEVVDYIEQNTGPGDEVNMRTMFNIFDIRVCEPERWDLLAEDQIDPNQELKLVRQLLDDHETVGEACSEFQETTGKSRSTFYRKKKKIVGDADEGLTAADAMA